MSGTGTTISNLPPAPSALLSDLVPVVQVGPTNVTMSVTLQQVHDLIFPSGAMTIAGPLTLTTGSLQLANNVALQGKNTTGTYQNLIFMGTDNNPHIDTSTLHLDEGNGIVYFGAGGANAIAFTWDGTFINGRVDGTAGTPGQMASVSWTTSWANANFLNKGAAGDTAAGAITVNGILRDAGGRIVSQSSGGNPSVAVWDTGAGVASAMCEASNGTLVWGDCDGNGVLSNGRLQLDRSSNLTAGAGLYAGTSVNVAHATTTDFNMYLTGNSRVISMGNNGLSTITYDNSAGVFDFFLGTGGPHVQFTTTNAFCYSGSFISSSDARLKTDIEPATQGLAVIEQLRPVRFRHTASPERQQIGFVAQDVLEVLPEAVSDMPHSTQGPLLGIADLPVVAVLVNAVKELSARIAALEAARAPP